jgi:hypothetical protein
MAPVPPVLPCTVVVPDDGNGSVLYVVGKSGAFRPLRTWDPFTDPSVVLADSRSIATDLGLPAYRRWADGVTFSDA